MISKKKYLDVDVILDENMMGYLVSGLHQSFDCPIELTILIHLVWVIE